MALLYGAYQSCGELSDFCYPDGWCQSAHGSLSMHTFFCRHRVW